MLLSSLGGIYITPTFMWVNCRGNLCGRSEIHSVSKSLLRRSVHSLKEMPCFTKHMIPPPRLSARSFPMWKYPGTQMDSSGMWPLHHVSVIAAMSAEFSLSISDSFVIFGTTDLMFMFTTICMSHFPHGTCTLLLPREITGGLVNFVRREVIMTGIFRPLWGPTRQPRWVGGSVECHPCIHAALQAALFRRVSLHRRKRCNHSAENVVMRVHVLATMVAHDHICMSHMHVK